MFLFISIFFIGKSDLYADGPTISGSNQMSVNTSQPLTASGGCGNYIWTIVSGGGRFDPYNDSITRCTGDSCTYYAPSSNPGCVSNSTIRVTDSCHQYGELQIAVNAVNGQAGYYASSTFSEASNPANWCAGRVLGSCSYQILKRNLYCDGSLGSTYFGCSPGHSIPCSVDQYWSWGETECNNERAACITSVAPDGCAPGLHDTRTTGQKASGCCSAALPDGGKTGPKPNDTGKTCPANDVKLGSSANFKSGNLFHSQDVGNLSLSYNSIDTNDGSLGKKWTHNYNQKLNALSDNSTLTLQTEDGNVFYFRLSGGIYYPEAITGDTSQIVKNADGTYTRTTKTGMIYRFDTTGNLTSIQDRNGRTTTLTYSGSDLTGITDFNGRTTTITNTGGKITSITDPLGRTYTIGYTNGYNTSITDPLNNTWQYAYDTNGRMLTKTDPAGRQITYTYDASGKVLTATDPEGKTRSMNYTESGLTTHTEKDGGVWTYKYDPTFTVKTEVTDPKGYTTQYTYNAGRNLIKKIEHDGSTTSYTYDENDNRLSVTDPLGKTTGYAYNSLNLVSSVTDPKGNITQYSYDAKGNLTTVTDPANAVTHYQYDARGNIISITTPLNKTTTMSYDSHNNLVSVTDPKSGTATMTYDNAGNLLTQTDALNNTTAFQYNSLNQLIQITDPKGYVTNYTYDYNGNRLSSTDANSNTTQYLYNYKDQLTKITDALNNVTNLSYSGAGCGSCGAGVDKLISVTDAKSHATAFEYDTAGNLTKETDPLGKITTYTYDGKGNLVARTSPDNKTITYAYDLNNRLIRKTYSDNSITSFQYDDAGNMTYAGNQSIAYNFAYDANNRITGITDSNSRVIQYTYDADGNRTAMITPDGRTITYSYDNSSLLANITTSLGNFAFAYDPNNRRITRTLPNGATSTYNYDENSRLTGIQTAKNQNAIDSTTYTHDNVGNRITKVTPQESWSFDYDNIYRLTQATPTGGIHQPETYTYDQVGNRLTKANEEPPQGNETTTYAYDDENRLTGVSITQNNKNKQLTFAYDPFGRRISRTLVKDEIGTDCDNPNICPRTTTYVYDNQNIILEYNSSNEIQTRYTHGPNVDEPLAVEVKSGENFIPYYYHADGLGSITALTDTQGAVVQRYEYDTFGNPTITTQGNINQPVTFTGREYDSETGMYFYRARYYDPKAGRFVTKDPIGFKGGINVYAYVKNNPVNKIDPWGLIWVTTGYDYHGVGNWARWYFNRIVEQIGKGLDLNFPGAAPDEYVGLKRDVLQVWKPDPGNPCQDSEYPIGTRRRVPQEYKKFINPGPYEALINNPDDPYYYQWDPWVISPTYQDYPNTKYENLYFWEKGK